MTRNTVTLVVPDGYSSGEEFAKDCGCEIVPTSDLTAQELSCALMDAHEVPDRYRGDSDTIADAINEAQKILDCLPWKVFIRNNVDPLNC